MKRPPLSAAIVTCTLSALLAGCGSPQTAAVSTLQASESCIGCHSSATSAGTGALISEEWKASVHNTENPLNRSGAGAGCRDCHEPDPAHPNGCRRCHGGAVTTASAGSADVVLNPDQQGKCEKCHGPAAAARFAVFTSAGFRNSTLLKRHFNNYTGAKYPASYVSSQYRYNTATAQPGNCRACHNPHDPTAKIDMARQWAESGHGNTTGNGWVASDFKTRGIAAGTPATAYAAACVRCHTSTGFISYVTSGFSNGATWGKHNDFTKEILACNACHDDGTGRSYGYKVRTVPSVTGFYHYSSAATGKYLVSRAFPDVGYSNICIACHTGREIGDTLKIGASRGLDFTNLGFINGHHLTGGATVFSVIGFEFYSSYRYQTGRFKHDRIGVANLSGTGNAGPCVACHIAPGKHTFLPVDPAGKGANPISVVTNPVCARCHSGSDSPWRSAADLQAIKANYLAAQGFLKDLLIAKGVMTSSGSLSSTKNWAKFGPGSGLPTMGAAFNYYLCTADNGGFAHNALYTKRLLYDAADWMDDGALNYSVGTTLDSAGYAGKAYAAAAKKYLLYNGTTTGTSTERPHYNE